MNVIPGGATIVRRNTVIANALSDSETVMLDIDRGMYFGVKDVGKAIWEQLEKPTTLDTLCAALVQEHDVEEETCRREVTDFVSYLVSQELVELLMHE